MSSNIFFQPFAGKAFFGVIEKYQPEYVIVWGK